MVAAGEAAEGPAERPGLFDRATLPERRPGGALLQQHGVADQQLRSGGSGAGPGALPLVLGRRRRLVDSGHRRGQRSVAGRGGAHRRRAGRERPRALERAGPGGSRSGRNLDRKRRFPRLRTGHLCGPGGGPAGQRDLARVPDGGWRGAEPAGHEGRRRRRPRQTRRDRATDSRRAAGVPGRRGASQRRATPHPLSHRRGPHAHVHHRRRLADRGQLGDEDLRLHGHALGAGAEHRNGPLRHRKRYRHGGQRLHGGERQPHLRPGRSLDPDDRRQRERRRHARAGRDVRRDPVRCRRRRAHRRRPGRRHDRERRLGRRRARTAHAVDHGRVVDRGRQRDEELHLHGGAVGLERGLGDGGLRDAERHGAGGPGLHGPVGHADLRPIRRERADHAFRHERHRPRARRDLLREPGQRPRCHLHRRPGHRDHPERRHGRRATHAHDRRRGRVRGSRWPHGLRLRGQPVPRVGLARARELCHARAHRAPDQRLWRRVGKRHLPARRSADADRPGPGGGGFQGRAGRGVPGGALRPNGSHPERRPGPGHDPQRRWPAHRGDHLDEPDAGDCLRQRADQDWRRQWLQRGGIVGAGHPAGRGRLLRVRARAEERAPGRGPRPGRCGPRGRRRGVRLRAGRGRQGQDQGVRRLPQDRHEERLRQLRGRATVPGERQRRRGALPAPRRAALHLDAAARQPAAGGHVALHTGGPDPDGAHVTRGLPAVAGSRTVSSPRGTTRTAS